MEAWRLGGKREMNGAWIGRRGFEERGVWVDPLVALVSARD